MTNIKSIIALLKKGELKFILKGIGKRFHSEVLAFGLKRDLTVDFENPNALIELKIRPFNTSDNDYFRDENSNLGLVDAHIENCYVAVNTDNEPCYRQWLIGASQNEKIKGFFKGSFPVLKKNEALLEAAFTLPTFRGKRIMPAAMARISEKGVDIGARYIITFVDVNNIPSLKGCKRSGFNPYVLRTEKWFLFKRRIIFTDISEKLLAKYNKDLMPSKKN